MAFDFPDPITTPEFTAPNGFTYKYDQGQGLWKLTEKAMKVIQKTGSIPMGDLTSRPSSNYYKMKLEGKSGGSLYYEQRPEAGFRWCGQNPETRRIIYYTDKWFGYSDDEGVTWQPTEYVYSMYKPGSGESSNGRTIDNINRSHFNQFVWCGGKQWIAKTGSSFGYIIVTFDDFETIYNTKFYSGFEEHNFGSNPWKSLKYDRINNEVWTTWGDGKIVQFDADLSKWLNPDLTNSGPTSLVKWSSGPDEGLLSKAQIRLRNAHSSGTSGEFYFDDIGLSGHGTKIAVQLWGQIIRTTDNFQTHQEINSSLVYNDPYYSKDSNTYQKNIAPGQLLNSSRVQYIEETSVWLLVTKNSFQVSFDDGITWVEMDYKTRGTKEDTLVKPWVKPGGTSSSHTPAEYKYFYYYPTGSDWDAGYLDGHYYYITQEVGDPKRNAPEYYAAGKLQVEQEEIQNAYCLENVMYVTADFKNWTRIPFGIDMGAETSDGGRSLGSETAFVWHSPGADRIFILSDGHHEQTPYFVNYIDGFK
jgi:hypothetical protein